MVLRGALGTIQSKKCKLIIEVHSKELLTNIIRFLNNNGYIVRECKIHEREKLPFGIDLRAELYIEPGS